jgi:hypothetical protein
MEMKRDPTKMKEEDFYVQTIAVNMNNNGYCICSPVDLGYRVPSLARGGI